MSACARAAFARTMEGVSSVNVDGSAVFARSAEEAAPASMGELEYAALTQHVTACARGVEEAASASMSGNAIDAKCVRALTLAAL